MKKLMAALLAVAMVCAMAIPAWAAGGATGSITIDKALSGETYTIYKMFDLNSYDPTANAYSYTVDSNWKAFFATGEDGANYITLDKNGHPTWVSNAKADEFAQKALAWAKTQPAIAAAATSQTADNSGVTFSNLALGYYLVDTSLGVLCGLDTTDPDVTIKEKNEVPTIEKKVKDSNDDWVDSNTAKIGDTVKYKVVITVKTANTNYTLHDTMSEGLTFNKNSVKVTVSGADVLAANYTLSAPGASGETFSIAFKNDYIASLSAGTKIEVTYSAVVNEKAKIDPDANENEAHLTFGNSQETTHDNTKTYLYQFDLIKYSGSTKKLLGNAHFELYDAKTGGNKIELVKNNDGTYRVATADEITAGKNVAYIETVQNQIVKISGLDKKVYWLQEILPPAGYNGLTERAEVNLQNGSKTAVVSQLTNGYDKLNASSIGGVAIENNTGTTLPGTGGIGTTIFYVIGGGLMAAAAILLITKKRMENR